jgi:hypothetical protein
MYLLSGVLASIPANLDLTVAGGTGGVLDTAIRWGSRDHVNFSQ